VSASAQPRSGAPSAAESGTFRIGGDLEVRRLGYGAMQITGKGVWGPPADPERAVAVLRRAVELGVTLIDTADSYGPRVSEELIARALHPYPAGLVIATKGGFERSGPNRWETNGRPAHLREACEGSLRRLKLDRIDLYQLHRLDPKVPAADSLGELARLQQEGKIRHIGLSEVGVDEIAHARTVVEVVSVQNRYNLAERGAEDALDYCEREGIGFLPWFPLLTGKLAEPGGPVAAAAARLNATPAQVALAWLLKRSPVMLPIPGTSSVDHLDENVAAAAIRLTDEQFAEISKGAGDGER
jgi:aryl-alcohol dehydrogenase-like predicted oxidoreductase